MQNGDLDKLLPILTHWGGVTHIYVCKLTTTGSDNSLSPARHQVISWINVGILSIRPLGTNCSVFCKISSEKWRPYCLGLNMFKCFVIYFEITALCLFWVFVMTNKQKIWKYVHLLRRTRETNGSSCCCGDCWHYVYLHNKNIDITTHGINVTLSHRWTLIVVMVWHIGHIAHQVLCMSCCMISLRQSDAYVRW